MNSTLASGILNLLSKIQIKLDSIEGVELKQYEVLLLSNTRVEKLKRLTSKLINIKGIVLKFQEVTESILENLSLQEIALQNVEGNVVSFLQEYNSSNRSILTQVLRTQTSINNILSKIQNIEVDLGEYLYSNGEEFFPSPVFQETSRDSRQQIVDQQATTLVKLENFSIQNKEYILEVYQEIFAELPPKLRGVARNLQGEIEYSTLASFASKVELVIDELKLKIQYNIK